MWAHTPLKARCVAFANFLFLTTYSDERNHDNGDTQNGVWVSFKTEGFLESLFTLIGIDERSARSHYAVVAIGEVGVVNPCA